MIHVTYKIQNVINWRQNDSVCFHLIEASVAEARVLSDTLKANLWKFRKKLQTYGRLTSQNLHLVSFFSYNAQKCLELDSEDKRKLLFTESLYHTHTNVPFHQANSQHDQLCPILILTIKQHYDKTPPSLSQTIEWKN